MTTLNIIFLILSAAMCILSYFLHKKGNKPIRDKAYYVMLAVGFLFAVALRVAEFTSVPGGVNQDEAMAAVDAYALATHGTDRLGMVYPVHFQAWGFGQMSVLLSYLMVPFIKLFGFSTFSIRLPMLIASLLGILFVYLFARDVFNRDLGLIVLFLTAVCPWHIISSRWSLDCNLFPHFVITGVYLLNHGLKTSKRLFIYLAMPVFGLCMYCYGISIYTIPVFLIFACIYLIVSKRIRVLDALICVVLYLFVAWPFIAMIIINTFGLPSIETRFFTIPYFAASIRKSDILFFSNDVLNQLYSNFISLYRIIFQIGDDSLCNVVPGFSTLYVFTVPFGIIGLFWLLRNRKSNPGTTLLLILFAVALLSGLITGNCNVNRENIIFYPLIILICVGIYRVIRNVKFSDMCIEIMFVISLTLFCSTYFTTYAEDISETFFEDFGEAVSSIDSSKYDSIIITPDVQENNRAYVAEILTLYYEKIDAEYYQSEEYSKKYIYSNPSQSMISSLKNSAFIFPIDYALLFDDTEYHVTEYGRYAVAFK